MHERIKKLIHIDPINIQYKLQQAVLRTNGCWLDALFAKKRGHSLREPEIVWKMRERREMEA